jgi:dTDP-4-dehydrorhamnose reductase
MKILVFGASGLLGSTLFQRLVAAGYTVSGFKRNADSPCNDQQAIEFAFSREFAHERPDCVINLIGATDVDDCERNLGRAAFLNCLVPQTLSRLCLAQPSKPVHLIHLSSDQVYKGDGPHLEGQTCPINVYALTKLVGEYSVPLSSGCVLRTNFFGKSQTIKRISFSDWLVNGARNGALLNVFDDVYFSPLGMDMLCRAIIRAIEIRLVGLYNLGSEGRGVSKAVFANMLFQRLGLETSLLNFVSIDSMPELVRRPRDMRMDSSKFSEAAAFPIPTIENEINDEAIWYTSE